MAADWGDERLQRLSGWATGLPDGCVDGLMMDGWRQRARKLAGTAAGWVTHQQLFTYQNARALNAEKTGKKNPRSGRSKESKGWYDNR